jgi:hypothetical protein
MLTACATPDVEYREKKVPIYMVPKPPTIERPTLPIHELEIDWNSPEKVVEKFGDIAQAYVITVRLLMNWGETQNDIVKAYEAMSERDFSVDPVTFSMAGPNTSESDINDLELDSESDYGTIDRFARQKFKEIEDKYHRENEMILQSYNNETSSDQEP